MLYVDDYSVEGPVDFINYLLLKIREKYDIENIWNYIDEVKNNSMEVEDLGGRKVPVIYSTTIIWRKNDKISTEFITETYKQFTYEEVSHDKSR